MSFLDNDCKLEETQRLEFKEAQVGLPDDIWETYSAFANTEGGEIVLGVSEPSPGRFLLVGVPNAPELEDAFWRDMRNTTKVERDVMFGDGVSMVSRDVSISWSLACRAPRGAISPFACTTAGKRRWLPGFAAALRISAPPSPTSTL